jgi:TatD DNase family protein
MPDFADDRHAVIARAREAGVGFILVPATEPSDFHPTLKLAQDYASFILPALGIHPHEADQATDAALALIRDHACNGTICAIGESGLDFYRTLSPPDIQQENLERHCELALQTGLPIILHCRDAYPALLKTLRKYPGLKVIQHSFSGTRQDMGHLLEAGCSLSFSGMVTYPRNDELRLCAREIPEGRLLLETDAPFLPPWSVRGKRNEPANVAEIYQAVAGLRDTRMEALSVVVEDNFARLIGLRRTALRPQEQEGFVS